MPGVERTRHLEILDALPISVVVPAYRCEGTIERAVRSAMEQQPAPAEVIVVDDASRDKTSVLAAALGARVLTHGQNAGEGAARNTGLRAAAEPWVALLDADDEWLPGHLAALWHARDGHVVVGTAVLACGPGAADHRVRGFAGRRAQVLRGPADVALPENKLTSSSVLVRKDVALAVGGFRPDLPRATDLDLWLRMLEHGSGLAIPQVTALYHQHGAQVSADRARMDAAQQDVLDAYGERPWCTRVTRRRNEGRIAWDTARAALVAGASPKQTLFRLGWQLAYPARALGVAQTLAGRRAARRLTARYAPGGGPSVTIMPGVRAAGVPPGAFDLRKQSLPFALLHLACRPTAQALVAGWSARAFVRLLGVEPVATFGSRRPAG